MLTLLAIAGAVFVAGNLLRIFRMVRLPVPLRWELYPMPKGPREAQSHGGSYFEETNWWTRKRAEGRSSQAAFVVREALALHSVWDGFRGLWLWSLLLHWGMYLYIVAVGCSLFADTAWVSLPIAQVAFIAGLIGTCGLLLMRVCHPRLRGCSPRSSIFNLLVLATMFATGIAAVGNASTLREVLREGGNTLVPLHLAVVAFFLAYFPLSHMTHAYMKFFTWHGVRWNDAPGTANDLSLNLRRVSTWAAPHISAGEREPWAEIVADPLRRGSEKRA